ncbi:MAG: putative metal-binding motif-containing protein [Candidatus Thiodiazotropha sp.]
MYTKKRLTFLMLGAALLTGAHEANARSSYTTDINSTCNNLGYDLTSAYASDSCTACHQDNNAKSAYSAGDYEYFCPAPDVIVTCTDADNDGYYAEGDSCGTLADFNDNEATAYPGATEDCSDGIDNDGNGKVDAADPNAVNCPAICTDMDADGYSTEGGSCGAIDCDDNNAAVNPGAVEVCSDAVDNNCNGLTDTADSNAVNCPVDCTDSDADGYSIEGGSCGAVDCDDNNPEINPGALEICGDAVDNNCNALIDYSDPVCQNDDTGADQCDQPWWRSKHKHHKSDDEACNSNDETDHDQSDDDDDDDRSHDNDHNDDDRSHDSDRDEDRDEDRESRSSHRRDRD